jgi:UDPglucose 6-dehydrogenase
LTIAKGLETLKMQVTIIGTGYVGLVTGACLAHLGHQVTCLDVDESKIATLRSGKLPIYEPGLEAMVADVTGREKLQFVTRFEEAIPGAEVVFICVGTPSLPGGQSDMSYVESAARTIGEHLSHNYCVIVNKSTVPIGSGDWVGMLVRQGMAGNPVRQAAVAARRAEGGEGGETAVLTAPTETDLAPFDVASNPEFLREGSAIQDALFPDRIVVGAESERAIERLRALYAPLLAKTATEGREAPFIVTDRASAEMIKYAANAFLATKISFINEIANICERVGADVHEVSNGIGLDARVGRAFLYAGIGWGGSCFPKDLASLSHTASEYQYDAHLLDAVQKVNNAQRMVVIRKLQERLKLLKGKTIALWGLAFKPGTDDVRAAPALVIAEQLAALGAEVRAYDPEATETARRQGVRAELCTDVYEASLGADAVVLVTEWPEFREVDWQRLRAGMRRPLIVDGRNALDRATLLWHGFECCGIGR